MPRDIIPLTNFSAGELSGRLFGRVDLSRYFNGAALLRNFITMVEGGVTRRSGTIFAAEVREDLSLRVLNRSSLHPRIQQSLSAFLQEPRTG